ncbi:flagellar hook-length control protein FliK [Oceanobacillus damuensis]|uniref:flagellar hook-length control protein FliK n=1 Tax=Oceanobacillus damuensis TaxID=937928 RepID=UPI00082C95CF|nr:flagellar hook-length control protein FliK [Oceanobacillus damuensis]
MNNVGMLFQQIQPAQIVKGNLKTNNGTATNKFQQLLDKTGEEALLAAGENDELTSAKEIELPFLNGEELSEDIYALLMSDISDASALLEDILDKEGQSAMSSFIELGSSPEELAEALNQILTSVQNTKNGEIHSDTAATAEEIHVLHRVLERIPLQTMDSIHAKEAGNQELLQKQYASLISQSNELLSKVKTQEDVLKASPKILELLQQWQDLNKGTINKNAAVQTLDQAQGSRESVAWKSILETFQKREHFSGKQLYNTDSKVTVNDVSKWVGKALEADKINNVPVSLNTSLPLAKLEQYAIYINQSQNNQSPDQQLMEQFQKIMNSSRLSTLPNGNNQLSITLRPDNLGEMMVRFTQVNGEMTVKILVTSAAAKEMLESNIHQLRNMFSPHQVVIEKQDLTVQSTSVQKEEESNPLKDQAEQQSDQSDRNGEQNDDNSFELQFEEVLMNEKV